MFGYVDSVITISKCQAPLIAPEELAQEGGSSGSLPGPLISFSKSHNEALFGAALPLFTLISQISELAHRRKDRVDEISELWFRQSALRIEMNLRAWKPNLHVSCRCFSCTSQSCKSEDLIDAAYAIQWASILRLHQVVEGYNRSDREVVECTAKILEYISRIRFGSSAESILIFPLVMAGSGVQDDEQRMMVRERWMVMERTIGFDNIYRARQMVEAVWKEMDKGKVDGTNDGGLKVNWAKIRYYDFPGVVLL
jgi:transcriptional activator protein UGA3